MPSVVRLGEAATVFTVKTVAIDNAADFLVPLRIPAGSDDQAVAYLRRQHEVRLEEAALDWNLARIVTIGVSHLGDGGGDRPEVVVCRDEQDERAAIAAFWLQTKRRRLVGFNCRSFDLPLLIQRSRYLGVTYPPINLARYGRGDAIDIRDILTFDDLRPETKQMPRSLAMFCRRVGLHVVDHDRYTSAEIPRLVAVGNWTAVAAHCRADVTRVERLAAWLGVIPASMIPRGAFAEAVTR